MSTRRRTRVEAAKEATICFAHGSVKAKIDNISLKGCLAQVASSEGLEVGAAVELLVHLVPGNPEFDLKLTSKLVRCDGEVVALDFTDMSPESFHHLIRLVQHNSENPEEIEKELATVAYSKES